VQSQGKEARTGGLKSRQIKGSEFVQGPVRDSGESIKGKKLRESRVRTGGGVPLAKRTG